MLARRHSRELLIRSLVVIPVLLLLGVQYLAALRSAERSVGIVTSQQDGATRIDEVMPGYPAEHGGLEVGDIVRRVAGRPIAQDRDYHLAAREFERGRPVVFEIVRDGRVLERPITPGTEWTASPLLFNAFLALAYLSMGILSLAKRPGAVPARVLFWLFVLFALESALPDAFLGWPQIAVLSGSAFMLLTGAQIGAQLHLASLIPERPQWLRRRPWVIWLYYGFGVGVATLTTAVYLRDSFGDDQALSRLYSILESVLMRFGFFVWATLTIVLLGYPALRHPRQRERWQAGLVLIGALPWCLYVYALELFQIFGVEAVAWLESSWIWTLIALPFPLSILILLLIESRVQNRQMFRLSRRMQRAGSVAKISELISRSLHLAFHTKCNYVFFRERSRSDMSSVYSSGAHAEVEPIPENYEILRVMDRADEARFFPEDLAAELPPEEVDWLERLRTRLVVPLVGTNHRLTGLLLLGAKASEEPYVAHDLEILRSLSGQIALAYENIGLQVEVHERDRVQREVLDRFESQKILLVKECPRCGRCYDSADLRCTRDGAELVLTLPVERTIEERYRLERVLGKGGVAVVYRAADLRLGRTVAVKVLAGSVVSGSEVLRRFEREARIIARLAHPRVVTIHDFGKTRHGCPFLVMEYVEGVTMGQLLKRDRVLAPSMAAVIFDQILDGLGAAHLGGVIHRDLKPDNVLIASADGGVKLLDFGLAKFCSQQTGEAVNLTAPGFIMGTLAYMAPEQLDGSGVDERTDLFAVGVMVFQALTGERPFPGRSPAQVLTSIIRSSIEVPDIGAQAPINRILERALAPDPAARYPSARALRQVLIPALRDLGAGA